MDVKMFERYSADKAGGAGVTDDADGEVSDSDDQDGSPFRIKAINHDNAREAEEISHLFLRQYAKTFPLKEVYDPQFWSAERSWNTDGPDEAAGEHPFASLVAMHGDRMVGHIAVRSCQRSHRAEIFLPVIEPDYRRHAIRLSFQLWRCLENLGRKQGWKQIVHYYCTLDPIFQIVAAKCFGSHEVGEIVMIDSTGENSSAIDGRQPALTVLYNDLEPSHELTTIYPPDEHLRTLEEVYRGLAIPREFSLDTSDKRGVGRAAFQPNRNDRTPLAVEPFELCINEALRLKQLRLRPELIAEPAELTELIRAVVHRSETDQTSLAVLLPLEERATPAAAKVLEANGFRFAGVLPEGPFGDQIMFSQSARRFSLDKSPRSAAETRWIEEVSIRLNETQTRRAVR